MTRTIRWRLAVFLAMFCGVLVSIPGTARASSEVIAQIVAFDDARTSGEVETAAGIAESLSDADFSDAPLPALEVRAFRADLAAAMAAGGRLEAAIRLLTDVIAADKDALAAAGAEDASAIRSGLSQRLEQLAGFHLQACPSSDERPVLGCDAEQALAALNEARAVQADLFGPENTQLRFILTKIEQLRARFDLPADPADQALLEALNAIADAEFRALESLGGPSTLPQTDDYETVRVFFGTNRRATGDEDPEDAFDWRPDNLSYGSVTVTVPKDRVLGSIPRPQIWDLRGARDGVHIVLKRIETDDDAEAFTVRLKQSIDYGARQSEDGVSEAFIYVHGHGETLASAARQTAQLAVDLDMRHGATFYSWPSGMMLGYVTSHDNVAPSIRHLKSFITLVANRSGADRVHIIAHSMGNRLLLSALEGLAEDTQNADKPLLDEVIWAAPDVDAVQFARRVQNVQATSLTRRMTLYSSEHDLALRVSRWLVGDHPRAGQSPPLPEVASRVQTVDTSLVSRGFLGHFDFSTGAINDMRAVIWLSLTTGDRCPLVNRELDDGIVYWAVDRARPNCGAEEFRRAISAMRLYGPDVDNVVGRVEALIADHAGPEPDTAESWRQALAIIKDLGER